MGWKITAGPSVEPLTTAEAKTHMRVDSSAEDTYIAALIKAARLDTENAMERQLITATYTLSLDSFPDCDDHIDLPRPPLQSVTSISYLDADGASQTWASSNYSVDTASEPGRITLDYGKTWPSAYPQRNAVTIVYKAGYGDASTDVPENIIHSVRFKVAHWFENRESVVTGISTAEVPMASRHIDQANRFYGDLNIYRLGLTVP